MDDDLLTVPGLDQLLERHGSSLDGSLSTHPAPQGGWTVAGARAAPATPESCRYPAFPITAEVEIPQHW